VTPPPGLPEALAPSGREGFPQSGAVGCPLQARASTVSGTSARIGHAGPPRQVWRLPFLRNTVPPWSTNGLPVPCAASLTVRIPHQTGRGLRARGGVGRGPGQRGLGSGGSDGDVAVWVEGAELVQEAAGPAVGVGLAGVPVRAEFGVAGLIGTHCEQLSVTVNTRADCPVRRAAASQDASAGLFVVARHQLQCRWQALPAGAAGPVRPVSAPCQLRFSRGRQDGSDTQGPVPDRPWVEGSGDMDPARSTNDRGKSCSHSKARSGGLRTGASPSTTHVRWNGASVPTTRAPSPGA
jgi:hypothetical protein